MATFSGAIALLCKTFNASIPSSNGNISNGSVLYTASTDRKTILSLTNLFNNLNGAVSLTIGFQRKDPQTGSYTTMTTFLVTGSGGGGNPFTLSIDQASVQNLINYGLLEFNGAAPSGAGLGRLAMVDSDRLVAVSGTCPDGSSLRIMGRIEEYYSSF